MKNIRTHFDHPHVLTVTMSRPAALNALDNETLDGLREIIQEAYQSVKTRGIIITGEGEKAFVAGADIRELSALNAQQALVLAEKGQQLFKLIADCPKPVIAAVNGFALGGGCELAMACHVRIATENAKFGQPEISLGIIPGYGGTQRLAQLVGRGKALELIVTGDTLSAQEAKELGLVNHVVATREEMMALAHNILGKVTTKSPLAVARAIQSVNAGYGFETDGYRAEAENFAACTTTQDFKEGTTAFLEKRKPNFTGQ
ncbi:enoyl-CoA hydratase/isomerase family protein [Chryseolinea soli]|uniref:Enoyl-CoA hydratase n=1 Tax=Chryseolinea soli TaxID=2321403 RepID=A0A385SIY6_9BACT|nr:enoyl-CoA hydratase-related protein [Chryseolinea soli]AYB31209.1 enoyl-CoA hydratase [Chryseolinea soli]